MIFINNSNIVYNPEIRNFFSEIEKADDVILKNFISLIPSTLTTAARIFDRDLELKQSIVDNRKILKDKAKKFHEDSNSITEPVLKQIQNLEDKNAELLVAMHQPNLFAYSGVFKKIILMNEIKASLHKINSSKKVIPMFLIIDHDFIGDHWTRVAQLPNIRNSRGILELRYPVNMKKRWQVTYNTPSPNYTITDHWRQQVKKWIKSNKVLEEKEREKYFDNFEVFWHLVEKSKSISNTYSDFNSFLMSIIVNTIWNYDTVFVRLSEISKIFVNGFKFLTINFNKYTKTINQAENILESSGINSGISSKSRVYSPIWLHCECGSKAPSVFKKAENLICKGNCLSCKREIILNLGNPNIPEFPFESISKISPRAIPILLLLSLDLGCSGFIIGTGGSLKYTMLASRVFNDLGIKLPKPIIWSSGDKYNGIGQREATRSVNGNVHELGNQLHELNKKLDDNKITILSLIAEKRLRYKNNLPIEEDLKKIQILKDEQRSTRMIIRNTKRIINILDMKPSIIDYAVNFGIENISNIWSSVILKNQNLLSDTSYLDNVIT